MGWFGRRARRELEAMVQAGREVQRAQAALIAAQERTIEAQAEVIATYRARDERAEAVARARDAVVSAQMARAVALLELDGFEEGPALAQAAQAPLIGCGLSLMAATAHTGLEGPEVDALIAVAAALLPGGVGGAVDRVFRP